MVGISLVVNVTRLPIQINPGMRAGSSVFPTEQIWWLWTVKRRWTSLAGGTAGSSGSERQMRPVKGRGDGLMGPACRWIIPPGAEGDLEVVLTGTAYGWSGSRTNINGQMSAVKSDTMGFVNKI